MAIGLVMAGCMPPPNLRTQQAGFPLPSPPPAPVIPWVPASPVDWPIWLITGGYGGFLVGGTGYTVGHQWPYGATPAIGIGALLVPSRLIGTWLGYPGPLPWPGPLWPDFPVWARPPEPEATPKPSPSPSPSPSPGPSPSPSAPAAPDPEASPIVHMQWTKAGWMPLPIPALERWPNVPWFLAPWGPVPVVPEPLPSDAPVYALGFPSGDGTPVSRATYFAAAQRVGGRTRVTLLDYATRSLQSPPSLEAFPDIVAVTGSSILLVARPDPVSPILLVDVLTGGIDPLPDLIDPLPGANGNASAQAAFIAYTSGEEGSRKVFLFDRRQRLNDPLSHLNQPGLEVYDPNVDEMARLIAVTTRLRGGDQNVALYDTLTGLVDPLPALNSPAEEFDPDLHNGGRWIAFITTRTGTPRAMIYDRLHNALDPLPELAHLGPVFGVRLSGDGYILGLEVLQEGRSRVYLYVRNTGIIDPVPELNLPGVDAFF